MIHTLRNRCFLVVVYNELYVVDKVTQFRVTILIVVVVMKLILQCNAAQCCTMLHNAAQCCTMLHNAAQCCTMLHNAAQCS
jgi:hypothetical protein